MHENHRKRLDKKVEEFGFEGLEEHEQLELILFNVIPRKDTNALAHVLLDAFGTLHGVLTAEIKELEKIEGVGHRTAVFLGTLYEIAGAVQRSELKKMVRLSEWEDIKKYVSGFFFGKLTEEAYVVFLNEVNNVISYSRISEGIQSETFIYPELIAKKAVLAKASKVIIAHNHPLGECKPSGDDISLSQKLCQVLAVLGIVLKDSVVVAKGECFSLKEHGYLDMNYKRY